MSGSTGDRTRVLIVGSGPPTAGGIPTFVTALVENEQLRGRFDIDFLNTTPPTAKRPGALSLSNFMSLFKHAWAVFSRGRKADVVHLNLAPAPLLPLLRAIVLIAAAKVARARVILHAHSGRIHIAARSRRYRLALRVALRLADELVVVSAPAEELVRSLGRPVTRLDNGIEVDRIPTGPKDEDSPLLAFVGTVCERKGLLDLRDALLGLKGERGDLPLRVVLMGDAKQEGPGVFERMQETYVRAGLTEVEFAGALDRQEVLAMLGRTSIFVLPSHWEGFPLSLLEAMAAGAAVVATDVGDISVMLDGGKAGMVVGLKQPEQLQAAIGRLIDEPELRTSLGAAARARVDERYTQETLTTKLGDLYERLAAHST